MAPIIVDSTFKNADKGLPLPLRNTASGQYLLQISNLDRTDPPSYKSGDYPRSPDFNRNVFPLLVTPSMPRIPISCSIKGFNPATTPILWRLQTRYVVGRYEKTNHDDANPRYSSLVDFHEDEWTGVAYNDTFQLFSQDKNVSYDNQTDRVAGGNCILTVTAKPPGASDWLQDYIHLRITGQNPSEQDIRNHTKAAFSARDPNILHMANAVFAWESNFKQFDGSYRTGETFHGVRFDWPHDPANFTAVAFDFGIGLSQYTHWGQETTAICWDWRENLTAGINELFDDLRGAFISQSKWRDWARRGWGRYNGGDTSGTGSYAKRLGLSADGQLISVGSIPSGFDYKQQTAPLPIVGAPPQGRKWPSYDVPASLASAGTSKNAFFNLAEGTMDKDQLPTLISLGNNGTTIRRVQDIAANAMKRAGQGYTLHNACAATLSAFLQQAGITVPMTLGAERLAKRLMSDRHWIRIDIGKQKAGDIGVTFDRTPPSGADHIYLVIKCIDSDKMIIADNQAPKAHVRYASGRGKTETEYFLRAPDEAVRYPSVRTVTDREPINPDKDEFYPWDDEDSNRLEEPPADGTIYSNEVSFGWRPDLPDHRDLPYGAMRLSLEKPTSLPISIDLRPQCPPIYDQGNIGSCTANALAGAYEYDRKKQNLPDFVPSRLFIYYNERNLEGTVDQDAGAYIRDGIKTLASIGVCKESSWPYDANRFADRPDDVCFNDAQKYLSVSYFRLDNTNIDQLRTCLAAGFPFVFGFTIYRSFFSADINDGVVPMPQAESAIGGHAVVAVGYDDSKELFIIRNSWGASKGDDGYYYMPYQYLTSTSLCDDFWTIRTVSTSSFRV